MVLEVISPTKETTFIAFFVWNSPYEQINHIDREVPIQTEDELMFSNTVAGGAVAVVAALSLPSSLSPSPHRP